MAISSTGATLYLVFAQLVSRTLTFVGNQILLRYLSPRLLGAAVQLELVSVTVLYTARESLRVALQRQPEPVNEIDKRDNKSVARWRSQSIVNISYLVVALGLLIGLVVCTSYLRAADYEVLASPDFTNAFLVYGIATILELLAEPSFLIIQQHALYAARARAETTAAMARCISACATAVVLNHAGHPASVLPFAIGQLSYACALCMFYYSAASKTSRLQHFRLLPARIEEPAYELNYFHQPTLALAATMYLQSIFKLLLTQGDALIMSVLSSLADQGAFALGANYGGLLARLIFQPIEESSRNTFGRLLHSKTSQAETTAALSHLSSLVHFYTLAALPLVTLAPTLVPMLTPYLFAAAFRTPTIASLLATYVYYIPFMAINGILDSFVTSVANPAQLRRQTLWMALFTALYATAAWFLLQKMGLGAQGLVWANIVNMTLRILWSAWFVHSWINHRHDGEKLVRRFWRDCLPHSAILGAALAAQIAQHAMNSKGGWQQDLVKEPSSTFFILGTQAVLFAGAILLFERDFLVSTMQTIIPQRLASKIPYLKRTPQTSDAEKNAL